MFVAALRPFEDEHCIELGAWLSRSSCTSDQCKSTELLVDLGVVGAGIGSEPLVEPWIAIPPHACRGIRAPDGRC